MKAGEADADNVTGPIHLPSETRVRLWLIYNHTLRGLISKVSKALGHLFIAGLSYITGTFGLGLFWDAEN